MAAKLIVLAVVVAVCRAAPFYFSALPGEATVIRAGQGYPNTPSIAYGIGGGFASDIAGIKNSNSFGVSYETGNSKAYGAGIGQSNGDVFAGGIGLAETNPSSYRNLYPTYTPTYNPYYTPQATPYYTQATPYYSYPYNLGYNNNLGRNNYGNTLSSAQNIGNGGTTIAQAQNGPYGSVASAVNATPYQSRFRNSGYGGSSSAQATSFSTPDGSNLATSYAHTQDASGRINSAVAASQTQDGVQANTAQTVQHNENGVLTSGATSVKGRDGVQISNAHAHNSDISTGIYY